MSPWQTKALNLWRIKTACRLVKAGHVLAAKLLLERVPTNFLPKVYEINS